MGAVSQSKNNRKAYFQFQFNCLCDCMWYDVIFSTHHPHRHLLSLLYINVYLFWWINVLIALYVMYSTSSCGGTTRPFPSLYHWMNEWADRTQACQYRKEAVAYLSEIFLFCCKCIHFVILALLHSGPQNQTNTIALDWVVIRILDPTGCVDVGVQSDNRGCEWGDRWYQWDNDHAQQQQQHQCVWWQRRRR